MGKTYYFEMFQWTIYININDIYRYDEMTKPGYDFNNPGWNANPGTGHFTQVVWKASTELGIGKAVADDGCVYVCARYAPGGNMMGDYEANVKKPNN